MKEVEVGVAVIALLREEGFEVYQEIQTNWGGTLDIAATRGPLIIAIELKVAPTYEVMEQALRWVPYVHHSYVGVAVGYSGLHRLCRQLLESLGLGLIEVRPEGGTGFTLDPRWNRKPNPKLRKALREEHKTWAPAGSSGTARWSPYKATCKELLKYVGGKPGCTLKEAVEGIRHHYSDDRSARGALVKWIEKGKIAGIRLEREGKSEALPYRCKVTEVPWRKRT